MSLEDEQARFFAAITGGPHEAVARGVVGGEDRLGLYAEMYWLRMEEALHADFPFLLAWVGRPRFADFVRRHLEVRASRHYSLGRLGTGFERSVAEVCGAGAGWFAELAALEWARAECFVAPDAPVLELSALAAITEDTFERARLVASPGLRQLEATFDLLSLWQGLERLETPPPPPALQGHLVVWRKQFKVFHVGVGEAEAEALRRVRLGLSLVEVCDAFAASASPIEDAFRAIGSWAAEGMLSLVLLED